MGLIAVAVRLDGSGKVIFSQQRLGFEGKPFTLYKFRKFPDAHGDIGPGVTMSGDVRMTRLGELLERTKLDELPQLWNILKGDMSFVGPRPESLRYRDLFSGEFVGVLKYMPGIFGPNQIAYRNESEMYPPDRDPEEFYRSVLFPQKANADLDYFGRSTIQGDLAWIARGIWVSFAGTVDWKRVLSKHGRVLTLDFVSVILSWTIANALRFSGLPEGRNLDVFLTGLWLMPLVILPTLILGGCYRHPVRLFALVDALRLLVVASIAWGLGYLILIGFFHRHGSVMLIPLGLLIILPVMSGPRVWWREKWQRKVGEGDKHDQRRIIIYGAGRRGSALVSLLKQGFPSAMIIGFLDDDDSTMRGRMVQGYKVLGSERDLATIHSVYEVEQVWMTFVPDEYKHKRLLRWCEENDARLVVLPMTSPFIDLMNNDERSFSLSSDNLHVDRSNDVN